MIHRALLGAIERFFAILLEHYEGNLPTWLAPTQVKILPITDKQIPYAEVVKKKLQIHGIRTDIDNSASTISYKIREAELQKIPYAVICGERETKSKKIAVRKHGEGNMGLMTMEEFVDKIRKE
jgi:threonyl-tRNA synthetase